MAIDVSKLVQDAFKTVGTVIEDGLTPFTYTRNLGNGTYDPISGTVTHTSETYNVSGVTTKYKFREVDNLNIQVGDLKLLVAYKDLPFEITGNDVITMLGKRWVIVSASVDPTNGALHKIQIRKA